MIAVEAAQEWMGFQVKDTTQMGWKAHMVSKPTETLLEMEALLQTGVSSQDSDTMLSGTWVCTGGAVCATCIVHVLTHSTLKKLLVMRGTACEIW